MRRLATLVLFWTIALGLLPGVCAAEFPDRPITLVIPFAPGGSSDAIARTLAAEIKEYLGQPIVVEYQPGAGGNIGAQSVAHAPADGQTLLLGTPGPLATNVALYPKLGFDPVRSFVPVIHIGDLPSLLLVHPSLPVNSVEELVVYARAHPGTLSYASAGSGGASHLAGVMFNSMTGVDLRHVPYRGTGPALNDLLAGHVSMSFTDVLTALPHLKAGKLRALGVASPARSAALPEVPTIDEQGLKGYDARVFFIVVAPAGTPDDRVKKLNRAFAEVLALPKVKLQLAAQGLEPPPVTTPEQLASFIPAQVRKWGPIVRQSGAQVD